MKEFRKTKEGFFICEECKRTFKNLNGLSKHLYFSHSGSEKYFNKWLRDENDNCKICRNITKFKNLSEGCLNTCSKRCKLELTKQTNKMIYGVEFPTQNKKIIKKIQKTCFKRYGNKSYTGTKKYKKSLLYNYGVQNNFQRNECKEKAKQTCKENYGVENISKSEYAKKKKEQTCIKNHGVKSGLYLKEKVKLGNLKNNGVEFPMQSKLVKEKSKKTCKSKYGVEYIHQNKEIHEKSQKTAKTLKQFKNTNIWYRGSYEYHFLDNFLNIFSDIQNANTIKYTLNKKEHYYHPDFYIPSKNLIIECKNSYLMKRDKKIIRAKKKAVISQGFNYIIIVDKNYKELNKLIKANHFYSK